MYKAIDIAKWFIEKAQTDNKSSSMTPLKTIKLCFIAQGTHLALYNEMLFGDSCQAWRNGPVMYDLYNRFGNERYYKRVVKSDSSGFDKVAGIKPSDKETLEVLEDIWESFGEFSGEKLSGWTHREGSAWYKAYHEQGGRNEMFFDMQPDDIKKEFIELIDRPQKERVHRPNVAISNV